MTCLRDIAILITILAIGLIAIDIFTPYGGVIDIVAKPLIDMLKEKPEYFLH